MREPHQPDHPQHLGQARPTTAGPPSALEEFRFLVGELAPLYPETTSEELDVIVGKILLQQSGYDREAVTEAMYKGSLYLAACPAGLDLSVYVACAMAQVVDQLAWADMVGWG
jgi:hypothetical protein